MSHGIRVASQPLGEEPQDKCNLSIHMAHLESEIGLSLFNLPEAKSNNSWKVGLFTQDFAAHRSRVIGLFLQPFYMGKMVRASPYPWTYVQHGLVAIV